MRSSNIDIYTITGAILVILKLCGQLGDVPWFVVLLPWAFEIISSAIRTFYFERKLAKEDMHRPYEDLDFLIDVYLKEKDQVKHDKD